MLKLGKMFETAKSAARLSVTYCAFAVKKWAPVAIPVLSAVYFSPFLVSSIQRTFFSSSRGDLFKGFGNTHANTNTKEYSWGLKSFKKWQERRSPPPDSLPSSQPPEREEKRVDYAAFKRAVSMSPWDQLAVLRGRLFRSWLINGLLALSRLDSVCLIRMNINLWVFPEIQFRCNFPTTIEIHTLLL